MLRTQHWVLRLLRLPLGGRGMTRRITWNETDDVAVEAAVPTLPKSSLSVASNSSKAQFEGLPRP
jgi:hypothetical protein